MRSMWRQEETGGDFQERDPTRTLFQQDLELQVDGEESGRQQEEEKKDQEGHDEEEPPDATSNKDTPISPQRSPSNAPRLAQGGIDNTLEEQEPKASASRPVDDIGRVESGPSPVPQGMKGKHSTL